ncbi:MAG: AraC family transcriptional regulator [Lachnospiraceae bacterium]|jgi:AraC-like DNA-binding protein|nr:AraC family transcriptional regulator [Lachnospiraceae bacterium]MCI9096432.1 AraC family transcriptional regulator [Lachnospiraceae bacterium]
MTDELLVELKKITPEEESILAGRAEIEKDIYMSEGHDTVEAKRLLDDGKLIQVRTHTRFVHFPRHTHNYIEVIYMCSGSTHHVIDGKDVFLQEGEVLLLNQKAVQEIYPAGMDDVAVNFIVLPEFFDCGLKMMGEEKNLLRDFVIDCLKGENGAAGYIHFKVADILPIQNLLENLIWSIWHRQPNKRSINQITMGLLFLQLMNYTDRMETGFGNRQQGVMISVLGYVEEHYRDGELSKLARLLHYDLYWLSREIKKITGKNYTELVQEKRLNQAVYLLEHTTMSVMDIGMSVGYDNISYFHRIFQKRYGMTPRKYRVTKKVTVK